MKNPILYSLLTLLILFSCNKKEEQVKDQLQLGQLNHEFSISEASRESFDAGLLLLHSFEYDDAREKFLEASKADANELMAYWGQAMTYYKALWGFQDMEAGREVMAKVGDTKEARLARAENDLERDFWEAIEILYGEGELSERNKKYAEHMSSMYEMYEGNQEVAAFYALGLMWSVPLGRDADVFGKSAKVVAGILEENPNHPGALHYTIHAYDDPNFAELAKTAANKYSKIAPDATHALHMPSHIYLALGMWDEVVTSNEASYAASVSRMERKGLGDGARGYHSYAWLHYGYLQLGRFDKAEQMLKDMYIYLDKAPTPGARSYLITMQNAQLVESGNWIKGTQPRYVSYIDLGLGSKSRQHFFRSLQAFENGDATAIKNQIDTLGIHIEAAKLVVTDEGIAMCSAGTTRYAPNRNDILRANTIMHQMEALIALLDGDDEHTEEHLKEAVALQSESEYSFGPPDIPYPSFEQYGEWLLAMDRAEDALVQFNESLESAPKRAIALKGKIEALKKLNRMEEADEVQEVLNGFWKKELIAMK